MFKEAVILEIIGKNQTRILKNIVTKIGLVTSKLLRAVETVGEVESRLKDNTHQHAGEEVSTGDSVNQSHTLGKSRVVSDPLSTRLPLECLLHGAEVSGTTWA